MVALQRQIFRNMNIIHVKSIELTHTVIPAIGRRNNGDRKTEIARNSRNSIPSHTTRDAFMN